MRQASGDDISSVVLGDKATQKIIHNSTTSGGCGSRSHSKRRKLHEAVDPAITAAIARDPTMALTAEERTWALSLKEAFQNHEDILACAITDMEIATYAIIDQGNLERSCERAICMQAFKMQYNINDTTEEGLYIFRRLHEFCPGLLLSIESCPNEDGCGSHALVMDLARYYPLRFLNDPRDFRYNIGAIYYMKLCTQPDFQSIRDGYRHLCECDGVTWENASFKVESRNIDQLLAHMPYRRRLVKCLRVPSVLLVLYSLMKPFLPKEEYDAFLFGTEDLQTEFPERIDQFYLQPNMDQAHKNMIQRCRALLTRRYYHQRAFRL